MCRSKPQSTEVGRVLMLGAIRLNSAGWRAFPIRRGDERKPAITGWKGSVPFTPSQVRRMPWADAVAVGVCLPPDVVVLDIDVKKDKLGAQQLEALETHLGPLPATRRQNTPSGGWHLLFDVSGLPEDFRYRAMVASMDGRRSDIDVIHRGHRYVAVYDESFFTDATVPVAVLPEAWWPQISADAPASPSAASGALKGSLEASEAISAMAEARPGTRNDTLNAVTFDLALWGRLDESVRVALIETAAAGGQSLTAIEATMASAVQSAMSKRRRAQKWLNAMTLDENLMCDRRRDGLLVTARYLADHSAAVTRGAPVGMAARQLAEHLRVCADTAHRYLKGLVDLGWCELAEPDPEMGTHRYQLAFPKDRLSTSDNHPFPPATSSTTTTNSVTRSSSAGGTSEGRERQASLSLEMRLWQHPALQPGPGRLLPRSSARVICALGLQGRSVHQIALVSGLSEATVRRCLRRLEQAGAVISDGSSYRLRDADVIDCLDDWVRRNGIEDRAESLRLRHATDREQLRESRTKAARAMAPFGSLKRRRSGHP